MSRDITLCRRGESHLDPTGPAWIVRRDVGHASAAVTVKLAADGTICVGTSATTHVLVDLFGELTSEPYWRSSIVGNTGFT